ncbi:MAG: hypothetical protein DGJ47_000809 [Rickettsiaceae bacterium]
MLKDFLVIKTVLQFIIPYIVLYAFYIQLNGEVSPGGGFQAGVIFASGLIAYSLIFGIEKLVQIFSIKQLTYIAISGVALYTLTGILSLIQGGQYLDYSLLASSPILGQHLGIFLIEVGVGLTVSSVMCLIYIKLSEEYA